MRTGLILSVARGKKDRFGSPREADRRGPGRASVTGYGEGSYSFRVEEESPFFSGHFPGDPILPGVGLLGLVMEAAESWEQRSVALVGLRDFRLRRVVRPGDALEVHLSRAERPSEVRFVVRSGGVLASSGVLILAPPSPSH